MIGDCPDGYIPVRARLQDVNVATHLVTDILTSAVQAAIVISNDSDLALPLSIARQSVPTGTVNPGTNLLAGRFVV